MAIIISDKAVVETTEIGEGTLIKEFAIVRPGSKIGRNVVIHPFVVIEESVEIGDDVEIFPGAFIGKEPKGASATARIPKFTKRVVISDGCSVGPHAVIFYDVFIGRNTLLGDGASIREGCRIGDQCIISRYVTINYDTIVGNRCKIMDLTHITGKSVLEDGVFVSTMVGSANDNKIGRSGYVEDDIKGPTIREGAAVGAGATLLPNVIIGKDSTVAAGAVVTRDVQEATVVSGIPAREWKRG